jgi:hypothetical protein
VNGDFALFDQTAQIDTEEIHHHKNKQLTRATGV